MDEPFGRQPRPVSVIVFDGEQLDIERYAQRIKDAIERGSYDTAAITKAATGSIIFRIYPAAVND